MKGRRARPLGHGFLISPKLLNVWSRKWIWEGMGKTERVREREKESESELLRQRVSLFVSEAGLPDGFFWNQKSKFGQIFGSLRWENADIFQGHLEYFTDIWDILWPFGTFNVHLVHFSGFGIMYVEKSGNPAPKNLSTNYKSMMKWLCMKLRSTAAELRSILLSSYYISSVRRIGRYRHKQELLGCVLYLPRYIRLQLTYVNQGTYMFGFVVALLAFGYFARSSVRIPPVPGKGNLRDGNATITRYMPWLQWNMKQRHQVYLCISF
jgi:hypothetical protein